MPNKLSSYLDSLHLFYSKINAKIGGDVAISVAHNTFANRQETTSSFVNQVNSITESLEAGFGLELDLHWDEKTKEVMVCHSPFTGCLDPILDKTPLEDVLIKVSDFVQKNPDRFVFINTEDSYIPTFPENPQDYQDARAQISELFNKYLPLKLFDNSDELISFAESRQSNKLAPSYHVTASNISSVLLASESKSYDFSQQQNNDIYGKVLLNYPRFFQNNRYDFSKKINPLTAGGDLNPNQAECDFFQYEHGNSTALSTSFDHALLSVSTTYNEKNIEKLYECGVRAFKFDYVLAGENEHDARPLQLDRLSLTKILQKGDLNDEDQKICADLLEQNSALAKDAKYPFPINSAFLAPLIGKPLADLTTLFAAAKYYVGIDDGEYQRMTDNSAGKYDNYNPAWSFASAAVLGTARELAVNAGKSEGYWKYPSFALHAAITATDLYLYSQSAVPLGISLIAATIAEKSNCPPIATTALRFGCSALVKYALDPGATWSDIAINTVASGAGAAFGAALVNVAVKLAGSVGEVCNNKTNYDTVSTDEESGQLHTSVEPYAHFLLTDQTSRDHSRS